MIRKATYLLLLLIVMGTFSFAQAQNPMDDSTEQIIADIFEQISEDSEVEIDFSNIYDDLMGLKENPIDLNNTNKEELEKLPFLSDAQIDNILYYLYRNSPMNSMYELQIIDGLDMTTIRMMLPFVTVKPKGKGNKKLKLKNVFRYGKNQLYVRFDRGVETKEGYKFLPEEEEKSTSKNEKNYIGDPFYTHLKYRFNYKNQIAFGITAEKDAGEQFWGREHKGYDFYSAHIELRELGKIKTLVLGDYRANFAQGLVMRTDFSMGKSAYVLQVNPRSTGLKKYTSTAEYNYFRGGGATIRLGKIDLTAFYSNRQIDGDTIKGKFSTINQTGLHRTLKDLQKKGTINQQVIGANITLRHNNIELGATGIHTRLDHTLSPKPTKYNKFYIQGRNHTAASINYRVNWYKLHLYGETAMTDKYAYATTNGLSFSPISTVSLVALYRYFSKEYDTFFATTFSETSRINNESGCYIGAEIRPIKFWKIATYIDSYRFPWIKYGIYKPSIGKDYLVQIDYAPKRNLSMYWRFKYEEKMKNHTNKQSVHISVLPQPKWQARYYLKYGFGNFQFKNQLDANGYSDNTQPSTYGYSALQDIAYRFSNIPLNINTRLQIFDAQNYNNRIYVYESDVLYAFSVPMNYGMGTRYYFNLKYQPNRHIALWLKIAQTAYADSRKNISTNNEEIEGNRKTDIRILLRLKF